MSKIITESSVYLISKNIAKYTLLQREDGIYLNFSIRTETGKVLSTSEINIPDSRLSYIFRSIADSLNKLNAYEEIIAVDDYKDGYIVSPFYDADTNERDGSLLIDQETGDTVKEI